ncbi:unnamed protein product [Vitrella brassicaformis CCMP3155]|uniref:Uncharacterized protein n=1 Tax=Vitrella brassicaformis (strain CCMP3155) TaxID=1169540 RepID=A0A0G4EUZ6_VITBC|nr:unnamed protein product [Vitrella brassicaformis CCMP3155]|eukprot:CEM02074.1 unnamed protein product [Vitrella brassicaformis CCMP3155]
MLLVPLLALTPGVTLPSLPAMEQPAVVSPFVPTARADEGFKIDIDVSGLDESVKPESAPAPPPPAPKKEEKVAKAPEPEPPAKQPEPVKEIAKAPEAPPPAPQKKEEVVAKAPEPAKEAAKPVLKAEVTASPPKAAAPAQKAAPPAQQPAADVGGMSSAQIQKLRESIKGRRPDPEFFTQQRELIKKTGLTTY